MKNGKVHEGSAGREERVEEPERVRGKEEHGVKYGRRREEEGKDRRN